MTAVGSTTSGLGSPVRDAARGSPRGERRWVARDARCAGAGPKSMVVSAPAMQRNANNRQSGRNSRPTGFVDRASRSMMEGQRRAHNRPSTLATVASKPLSINVCWTTRARVAPIESRSDNLECSSGSAREIKIRHVGDRDKQNERHKDRGIPSARSNWSVIPTGRWRSGDSPDRLVRRSVPGGTG